MTDKELAEAGQRAAAQIRQENAANRVILREAPKLPRFPISPQLPLNLSIGALAGLAISPLLALVVRRVAHRHRLKAITLQ
jgi:capsular polysaccharide biosynthesis protein